MPWHIAHDIADCSGYAVVKDSDGSIAGCHPTKEKANKQLAALYANEGRAMDDCVGCEHDERAIDQGAWDGAAAMSHCASADAPGTCYGAICAGRRSGSPDLQSSWALPHHARPGAPANAAGVRNSLSRLPQTQGLTNKAEAQRHLEAHMAQITQSSSRPPRDGLVRMQPGAWELRDDGESGGVGTLVGHFAVFNQWTEINSITEGHFMERVSERAFNATLANEQARAALRVTFQHGKDPQLGDKVLGMPTVIEPDEHGVRYEVPLFDTSYNRDLRPGLEAGAYGSSFRFSVMKEEFKRSPGKSTGNPEGLPERTIQEAQLYEFGPVTYPAYPGATAGIRSVTDDYLVARFAQDPELLRELLGRFGGAVQERPAAEPQSAPATSAPAAPVIKKFRSREEYLTWLQKWS